MFYVWDEKQFAVKDRSVFVLMFVICFFYKEHSTPGDIALTIELMFNPNRATERILP